MIKRLTERDEYGNTNIIDVDSGDLQLNLNFDEMNKGTKVTDALNRLAAYEDTGLTPEEVQKMARAKAEGRLVVLPCKAGDTIWKIKAVFSYFSKPMEDRVERIIITNSEILVYCTSGTKFSVNSIGKTVFLTREEAEKALEDRNET